MKDFENIEKIYKKKFPLLQFANDKNIVQDPISIMKLNKPTLGESPTEKKRKQKILDKIETIEDNIKQKTNKLLQDMYINFDKNFDSYLSKNKQINKLSEKINTNCLKINNLEEKLNKLLKIDEIRLSNLEGELKTKLAEFEEKIKNIDKKTDDLFLEQTIYVSKNSI